MPNKKVKKFILYCSKCKCDDVKIKIACVHWPLSEVVSPDVVILICTKCGAKEEI
jgi:hypothetical protein